MPAYGEDEQVAGTDGFDDFLGPQGRPVDVGFIHPDGQTLGAEILDQFDHLLLVLPRVTYKNVRCHVGGGLEQYDNSLSMSKLMK